MVQLRTRKFAFEIYLPLEEQRKIEQKNEWKNKGKKDRWNEAANARNIYRKSLFLGNT